MTSNVNDMPALIDDQPKLSVDVPSVGATIDIGVWVSDLDGVPVVQIDTTDALGRIRINLNEAPVFDRDPDAQQSTERWDVHDIADELEDVKTMLVRDGFTGAAGDRLHALIARTWEASRLDTFAAHALRDERFAEWAAAQS